MIDYNTIMYGNWVLLGTLWRQVGGFDKSCLHLLVEGRNDREAMLFNYVNPIILAPDVLMKNCGFTKAGKDDKYGGLVGPVIEGSYQLRLIFENHDEYGGIACFLQGSSIIRVIAVPYLHTLQNYYPAWTGTQLEIKPDIYVHN